MADPISQIIEPIVSGGKWLILLPIRLLFAFLNLIPTPFKTYEIMDKVQFGQIIESYKIETTNPVRLGHFIIGWSRGDFCRTAVSYMKTIQAQDIYIENNELIEDHKKDIWAISLDDLNKIKDDLKIW